MAQSRKHKNQYKFNTRSILSLLAGLGFLTIILLVTMISVSKDKVSRGDSQTEFTEGSGKTEESLETEETQVTREDGIVTIVKAIDIENQQVQLYDINKQELMILSYSGGTNITDKYGQIISMNQIEIGSMVDAVYREDKGKLTDMNISTKAWEYVGVNNLTIDRMASTMKIVDNLYKYENDILILDGTEFISVTDLAEQDELTIRGFEETIWSITVTRGHGTVILEDYEAFLGDSITIGYEAMQQISDGLEMTVREGNFNLSVERADYSATKNITVNRNEISYVSLSDLGPDISAKGLINFEITPFGADLLIDREPTSYANPVEMEYGEHEIKVSLGGYTSFEGTLTVDSSGKTIHIDLPETTSEEEVTVTETDTDTTGTAGGTSTDTIQELEPDYSEFAPEDIDDEHKIYIQEPVGTSVYIDGNYMCLAPGSVKKIIGTHVITFIKEGYKTMSYTIEISDDDLDSYLTFPNLIAE